MKNNGFFPILINLAILCSALLFLWVVVRADRAEWVIPTSEGTAEALVSALGAHRYEGAQEQLSKELQDQVSSEELQELVQSIEQGPHKGIQDAHGEKQQEGKEIAIASVQVKLGDNSERSVELPLKKENGLWKVTSIESLNRLPGSR